MGLVHNALELVLEGGNYLLSDVFFHQYGQSDVMVLFATATAAWKRSDHIDLVILRFYILGIGVFKGPSAT